MNVATPREDTLLSIRGFISFSDADKFQAAFDKQYDDSVDTKAWSYRAEVLQCAMKLIGNLQRWLTENERSPYLYGRRYDFLLDTLTFVETGKRRMSVQNWLELLEEDPRSDMDAKRRCPALPRPKSFRTETFLAQWCAQPKGFLDMLCSLNVLYGSATPHVSPAGSFERLSVRPL